MSNPTGIISAVTTVKIPAATTSTAGHPVVRTVCVMISSSARVARRNNDGTLTFP
ncbi:hypothetical protein GCM10009559_36010 [Pseudonocardia zijingensis]|uniref:Uncharacterized protein n=1 Tax=Pseudonocardia zijingensis TaxID=153376 RepID=A0ABP4AU36_9PSEU